MYNLINKRCFTYGSCVYASASASWKHPRIVQTKAVAQSIIQKIDELNKKDTHVEKTMYLDALVKHHPKKYQEILEGMNKDILNELEFLRVMYTPPLNPGRRIMLRNNVRNIILGGHGHGQKTDWTETELAFFEHILKSNGCI